MIWLLFSLISTRKPIVIIPPLFSSRLLANFSETGLPWYCPQSGSGELLWPLQSGPEPSAANCIYKLLTVFWDSETDRYSSRPNTTVYVGSSTSGSVLDRILTDRGWSSGIDLFTFDYDWRVSATGTDLAGLTSLIESAYGHNNNTKVSLIGSAGGSHLAHYFLSHSPIDWRRTYLDRVLFVAPTFGGASFGFESLWMKRFPGDPGRQSADVSEFVQSLPVFMSHLPNFHIFPDSMLIHNQSLTARDLPEFLVQTGKIRGDNAKILDRAIWPLKEVLAPPDIATFILFNGAIETNFGWRFKHGLEKAPKGVKTYGDGIVPSDVIDWVCRNWSVESAPIVCVDIYRDHRDFEHDALLSNPYVLDLIVNASVSNELISTKGRRIVRQPYVTVSDTNYTIRSDIRAERLLDFSIE
jgi:hypothetical protein